MIHPEGFPPRDGKLVAVPELAIRTEGLKKVYRSGQQDLTVFADMNLEVRQGERLALVGASGSGKSTLLHLLGGLDRPTAGRILFGGREINSFQDEELADFRNREIGFVWQIHYLLPEFTALENVMMPLLIRGLAREDAAKTGSARLAEVGLADRGHHMAGELSGGEQQRVALARALVTGPKFMLADEPTGSLDYKTGGTIQDLLKEMHGRHKLTSIYVTHNPEFAKGCDRVLRLEGGKLREGLAA